MEKPRVLMIGPGRNVRGGITTVVNNYYKYGLDEQVNLKYITTMEDGTKLKKLFVAAKAYMEFCFSLKNYDIVHVHMAEFAGFDRKALFVERAKRAGKKIIIHEHAGDFDVYYDSVSNRKRARIRKIFSYADILVVLAEKWAEYFSSIYDKDRIVVIYNAVLPSMNEKTDYSGHNVLTLGKLYDDKGTYELLEVIPKVLESVPDAMFYICGDGEVEKFRKLFAQAGLEKNVVIPGWVKGEEKDKYLNLCSTYLLPSHCEGMPMSVLEAMSSGLAVISTNVGGIPEIIENNVSGILTLPKDVPAITEALIRVLKDEKLRERLGKEGKKRIEEKFDMAESINKVKSLYLSI